MRSPVLVCLCCLGFVLGVVRPSLGQAAGAGGGPQPTRSPGPAGSVDPAVADYVIGPDDVLSVVFWRETQLSGDVLVRPDGKISVPLLDDIQAAGLTPKQLRDRLASEARRYLTDAVVTIVVKQINSRRVYIIGEVARPGQYPLTSSMTVLQLIATAGGLQEYAKAKDIVVMRVDEQGRSVSLPFDYEAVRKGRKTSQNIELKSGDTVLVP